MIDLNFTNEEKEALNLYVNEKNEAMNQMLISDCETDIALLSDEVENEVVSISYNRESIIENLKNIKLIYKLILKQYYKTGSNKKGFFRGTNLAEIERLKNEPYIDKILSATDKKDIAEEKFAAKWNRPASMNLKLDTNVPYIYVDDILNTNTNEIIIAPFTKIKSISISSERTLENNSKLLKTYDVELEKQELEELTDKESFGLYNYILDNSYLIKRKLEECIKLEKENAINFENIRKLEQLLAKYENSIEEKEVEKDYSDIDRESDYNDIERINKELDELKKISTNVFEIRKENIKFINMWKRNIAVYMISECKKIEKQFLSLPEREVDTVEENAEENDEINEEENEEVNNEIKEDITSNDELIENEETEDAEVNKVEDDIADNSKNIEESNTLQDEEIENEDENTEDENTEDENTEDEEIPDELCRRVKLEVKENLEEGKKLLDNIKILITKQQNHAKIAGNMGATYSALNNAFEMKKVAEILLELLKKISSRVNYIVTEQLTEDDEEKKEENRIKLENISKANIEISTLMNYLNNPKIAVKNSKVTRFDEMAIIEENELKKGIAEKIRYIRGEAELKKLKDDLEIIEDKSAFNRFIGIFTGQNKLDDFMVEQIGIRQRAIRKTLSRKLSLAYNYSIHELMAEITMFVDENEDDELVEDDVMELKALAEELRRNYVILESKVQSIIEKKEGKNLPLDNKKISKSEIIEIETYRFLNKYGYDIEDSVKEPKYQDTMANEIARIVEYINSSKIF
jgi:hypothetical protein